MKWKIIRLFIHAKIAVSINKIFKKLLVSKEIKPITFNFFYRFLFHFVCVGMLDYITDLFSKFTKQKYYENFNYVIIYNYDKL